MKRVFLLCLLLLTLGASARAQQNQTGDPVSVRAGIKHEEFDRLLKKYVNERGLVNYSGWKQSAADLKALDEYLQQFAAPAQPVAEGSERTASLVNAYNAFVLQWILSNYPTESIWALKDSFKAKRNEVGGKKVALNDIEHGALRPSIGWRAHAVLVCAARSCPPLQRLAYSTASFEDQDGEAFTTWLGREDLNKFTPPSKAELSSIFKWFKSDFEKTGGVAKAISRYAPEKAKPVLAAGNLEVGYLPYNWGLNDQGEHGRNYSKTNLFLDNIFK